MKNSLLLFFSAGFVKNDSDRKTSPARNLTRSPVIKIDETLLTRMNGRSYR